jgi:uncharacterized membrane protein (UPF0136 family)
MGKMGSSITVKYQLTQSMAEEAGRQFGSKKVGAPAWVMAVIVWVLFSLPLRAVLAAKLMTDYSKTEQLAVASVISAVIVGFIAWRVRKARSTVEPQEVTFIFTDLGVDKRDLHSESKLDWKAFEKFLETQKYFFLCYPNNTVDIVPKEAFTSPQDAEALGTLISSRLPSGEPKHHPIRGRTRWVFYILFFLTLLLVFLSRSCLLPPKGP